jgi:hypothetical protein
MISIFFFKEFFHILIKRLDLIGQKIETKTKKLITFHWNLLFYKDYYILQKFYLLNNLE